MSRRDVTITLQQMLDYAQKAFILSKSRRRSDLDKDLTFNLALTRLVEVIGEAADRVPNGFQEKHPDIEWAQIIGMRNRLIHGYDEVDFDILWLSTVQMSLRGCFPRSNPLLNGVYPVERRLPRRRKSIGGSQRHRLSALYGSKICQKVYN